MSIDADRDELLQFYRALTTEQLLSYHEALGADRRHARRRPGRGTHTAEFCEARRALIAQVLGERGVEALD